MVKKTPVFITILLIGLVCGILIATKLDFTPQGNAEQQKAIEVRKPAGPPDENVFVKVAELVGPSVVSISTEQIHKIPARRFVSPFRESPFGEEDFFDRFFKDFFGEIPEREFKQRGLGSGIIIDKRGYILTNEHVVGEADKITITLPDGREFKGKVKGKDIRSDIAVVKIDAKNILVAKLGDSDTVKIGQWAIAIGNPFGFMVRSPQPTVTVGVISATGRSIGGRLARDRDYSSLIQTDAAINPGNSGGPLVNIKGEVIGINVAIFSTTGGYQGVGFAIPINTAKYIIEQLIEGKEVLYGWLGVNVQEIDQQLADYFDLPDRKGVLVAKVLPGSPAEKGGLKEGDIIKTFDGKEVTSLTDLITRVGHTKVGEKVKVKIIRDKKEKILEIKIGKRPEGAEELVKPAAIEKAWRGIEVAPITPETVRKYRLTQREGVVVINIKPGSPADEAWIRPGDVIDGINNLPVKDIKDYKEITKKITADALIRTQRGYTVVKPPREH